MSHSRVHFRWLVVLLALGLAGCSGKGPQLIGTYPKESSSSSYAPPPANLLVVYNAYLELEVSDPDAAARQATRLVYDHGGYLVSSDTWYSEGRKFTTLTLAVPVAQFDPVHQALLDLGQLVREDISGDRVNAGPGTDGWNTYSNITLQLRPASGGVHISLPSLSWNPVQTVRQAFGVFASIFTFLVDIAIWLLVVVGPFVLMGWGAVALVKRARKK
jgi:hypothetical protein